MFFVLYHGGMREWNGEVSAQGLFWMPPSTVVYMKHIETSSSRKKDKHG
jgi:hypothetical protein